jgi:two-component system, cell cycle response regulator DivK
MSTILIAEDDANNVEILTELLSDEGYRLVVARNAADAVSSALTEKPDLILMDLQMPDSPGAENVNTQAGLDATQRIKSDPAIRHIPIVALTAHNMMQQRERVFAAGCDAMQTKPYNFNALLDCIAGFLEKA